MRILIVGASQGTGGLAVKDALARGHEVSAFARSPDKLGFDHPKLRKIAGNFHQKASVDAVVPGHDAVIVTASATKLAAFKDNPRYFSAGTDLVIAAMQRARIRRLVVLSALGVGDSYHLLPPLLGPLMVKVLLKVPFADHAVQEARVRASGLDWVIARPGRLTDGPAKNAYKKTAELAKVPAAIARADVAAFLVDAATSAQWLNAAVHLGG